MKSLKQVLVIDFYKFILGIVLISIGAGVASYILHTASHEIVTIIDFSNGFTWKHFFISLVLALISYTLSKTIFTDTHGSGIPQVKLSLIALKGKMPKRMPFGKLITTILSLSSGLSLGKEGPMVTISASWAHFVSHILKLNRKMTKILVASGSAAGLSAAFNTPIAAVVFTIEEILGELNTKYLGPIIITSVIASITSYELLGSRTTFDHINYSLTNKWYLFLFLFLGLGMSLVGYVWVKSIIAFKELKKRYLKNQGYLLVVLSVCLLAALAQINPSVIGDGIHGVNLFLKGNNVVLIGPLLFLFIAKFFLSSTAYSSGISGGLFMPILFLGACGGSLFGVIVHGLGFDQVQIGAFALLGMTSLLVSVIRAPFTAFILLFEMTRDYELILPLMVSSIAAYWFSDFISPESVYEEVSEYEGVHLPTAQENEVLSEMVVEECMISEVICFESNEKTTKIFENIKDKSYGAYPVKRGGRLVGMVSKSEIRNAVENEDDCEIEKIMNKDIIKIYPDQSLLVAMDKMKRYKIGRLPVLSRFYSNRLVGIITPEDIVLHFKDSKSNEEE